MNAAAATGAAPRAAKPIAIQSPAQRAWRRFARSKLALLGIVLIGIIVLLAIGAPLFAGVDPLKNDLLNRGKPPSPEHWFGTDRTGRDIWSRALYGGRISLLVGVIAASVSAVIGTVLGIVSGFVGGIIDNLIMRLTDAIMSFPLIVIMLAAAPAMERLFTTDNTIWGIMLIVGLLAWPQLARLMRSQTLALRSSDYVTAAQSLGAGVGRQMFVHMLPQVLGPLMVFVTFGIANAILLEAGLSFLGQGIQPPTPTWGNMVETARTLDVLENLPWMWVPASVFIVITVVSINFIGDALRDAFDPKSR